MFTTSAACGIGLVAQVMRPPLFYYIVDTVAADGILKIAYNCPEKYLLDLLDAPNLECLSFQLHSM